MARQASALLVRLGAVLLGLALVGRLASASAANRAMADLALVASAAVVVVGLVGSRLTGGRKPPAPGSGQRPGGQGQHRQPADRRARRHGLPSAAPLVSPTGEQATTRRGAQE